MYSKYVLSAKDYITNILWPLEKKGFYFHNLDHTLDVFDRATYLLEHEDVDNNFKELVQIAVLFHDSWFLINPDWHENIWAKLFDQYFEWNENLFLKDRLHFQNFVDDYFSDTWYSVDKIDIIKHLILATIPSRKPSNKLEWLIKDADIDNLGRDDFFIRSELLRKEMKYIRWKEFTDKEWYTNVYQFVKETKFFTPTQIKERSDKLRENLREIKKTYLN